jgi:4-hydroxy-3-polyprenylbenzoate decarboxylase
VSTENITLAVTGASGSIYAVEMLRALVADERVAKVNLVVSESALRVFAEELGMSGRHELVKKLLGATSAKVEQHPDENIGAAIASGSYPGGTMIVLPCSMGTLARVAHGMASSLIERAADVTLKERRRLVLCVRETPFNLIHLRNMTAAAEAGATIYPVMATLYNHPENTDAMARQYVMRVLAHVGLPQAGMFTWGTA